MQYDYRFPYPVRGRGVLGNQGFTPNQSTAGVTLPQPRLPTPNPSPIPTPGKPSIPAPGQRQSFVMSKNPAEAPAPKPVSTFMLSLYKSIQNLNDPDEQNAYLQDMTTRLQERLGKYEYRLARGQALTPEQQQQYLNLQQSFRDVTEFMNDPGAFQKKMDAANNPPPADPTKFTLVPQLYPAGDRRVY